MEAPQPIRFAINGFGRIGRLVARAAIARGLGQLQLVAINDPFLSSDYMVYMLKHDSVHGKVSAETTITADGKESLQISVKGQPVWNVRVLNCKDPKETPWQDRDVGAAYIVESSGVLNSKAKASPHLREGGLPHKVIISAPSKDECPTIVMGVNDQTYTPDMSVLSMASCTTNCLATLTKVLDESFGVEEGLMSTVHAVTASQHIVDAPSARDWRAGRAALNNIVPASTGAAKALHLVIPHLKGKLTGSALRVPVLDVSVVELTARLTRGCGGIEGLRAVYRQAAKEGPLAGILAYTEEAVVSSDFIHDSHSCIFDAGASLVLNDHFVKVAGWYDNEWGYSVRIVDLLLHTAAVDASAAKAA